MTTPYTKEEVREMFLDHIRCLVKYWDQVDTKNTEEKLDGLAFSMLNIFDGSTIPFPAFDIVAKTHPNDKDYCKENNERWFEDGTIINDDVMLHEIFYR